MINSPSASGSNPNCNTQFGVHLLSASLKRSGIRASWVRLATTDGELITCRQDTRPDFEAVAMVPVSLLEVVW